jgi:16S rRNA (adenine1518-N6/adenine1519-N6)-dimethyltransferase
MVMMMQKEVAQRLSAANNTKDFNSLSVFIQYHTDAEIILNVSRNVFIPKPNVDSAVIKLTRLETPRVEVADQDKFFRFVRDCFRMRRKTIKNNLKGYDIKIFEEVFDELEISLTRRAESISLHEFASIYNLYVNKSK